MALNFPASPETNDTYTEGNITWQFNGTAWNVVSSASAASIPNSFNTVAVVGQSNIVADSANDTLTIAAGSNIIITTDAATDTVTIGSTVSGGDDGVEQNLFATVAGDSGSTTANTSTDTLTIAGGVNISTTVSGDTVTVGYTGTPGIEDFTDLTEINTSGLTVDKIYIPAITMLEVTNNGATAYRFDQYGTSDNPTIYALNGATIAFNLKATGHPFLIQNPLGNNYDTGLIHVAPDGTVSLGSAAQGKDSGTLYWKVPQTISGGYRYQCSLHAGMVGSLVIKDISVI